MGFAQQQSLVPWYPRSAAQVQANPEGGRGDGGRGTKQPSITQSAIHANIHKATRHFASASKPAVGRHPLRLSGPGRPSIISKWGFPDPHLSNMQVASSVILDNQASNTPTGITWDAKPWKQHPLGCNRKHEHTNCAWTQSPSRCVPITISTLYSSMFEIVSGLLDTKLPVSHVSRGKKK